MPVVLGWFENLPAAIAHSRQVIRNEHVGHDRAVSAKPLESDRRLEVAFRAVFKRCYVAHVGKHLFCDR